MSSRARSPPGRSDYRRRDRRDDRRDGRKDHYRDRDIEREDRSYRRRSPDERDRDLFSTRDRDRRYEDRLSRHDDPPMRRDRSKDRKRSRERSPGRDRRGHSRDRDGRDPRDSSRDRKRPRRNDSVESKRRAARNNSRERRIPATDRYDTKDDLKNAAAEEERKKAERQAKVAEWKKKQEAKKKEEFLAANSPRPRSVGADSIASPTVAVRSPAVSASPQPASPNIDDGPAKPYAGKFDPRAIAKKAAAASSKLKGSTLEDEASLSTKTKSTVPHLSSANKAADSNKKNLPNQQIGSALKSTKSASKAIAAGFGLNKATSEANSSAEQGPMIDMGDDEVERKTLARLPVAELEQPEDTALANGEDEQEDEGPLDDMADGGDEEEQAAAARAVAERRATAATAEAREDEQMTETQPINTNEDMVMADEGEEIDPLDAFMGDLTGMSTTSLSTRTRRGGRLLEPEAMFGDDEDNMEAVGDDDDILDKIASKKKKRELPEVDHKKMDYEPFRKNFYTEPLELQDLDDEEVRALRFELDDIKVQGANVPKPVQKFAQFGLGTQTLDIIRKLGFDKPTSIQAQAIPAIMSGRDVLGVAKTGSGKTVAFLLPMFRHIKDQPPLQKMDGPIGLILAPTRELATQIHKECKPYLRALDLRAVCCYGGAPIKDQIAELKKGAEIIVCTPGRLVELLTANQGRVTNLHRVTYLVLDEADRMFDMGFEPQITKLHNMIRPGRQTVLFSATFSQKMETLARKALSKAVQIVVGGRSVVAPEITQMIEVRPEAGKWHRALELLGELFDNDDDARALIFVERQEKADNLLMDLQKAGYPCVSIHGGREQIDRDTAIDDFKRGDVPIMIATSVAARGLDVKQLKLVINYDVPNHLEDYVHRSGRTGRAGNKGTAVTFITEEQDKYARDLIKALTHSEQPVPPELQQLQDSFDKKLASGEAKPAFLGFTGRGLETLEAKRDAERKREKRAFKTGDEPDEDDEEKKDKDKDKDKEEKPEDKIAIKSRDAPVAEAELPPLPGIDLNAKVQIHKTEKPAPTAGPTKALDRVAQAAANINNRLGARGTLRPGVPIDNKGPDAGAYHATLEINDLPQKARWAVTNRTNVAKVLESTGASITNKGQFYAPGKTPATGELPKMYVLVEADTELQVEQAVRELQRLLREGQIAAAESDARAPGLGGRYKV